VFRVVEPLVFEQLAQEAVAACTSTLLDASRRIARNKKPGNPEDDADLFLVKHLLLLREQISPFHAALSSKDFKLDFAPTSHALAQIFRRRQGVDSLLRLIPTVAENEVNTKRDLDLELRRASEAFIDRVTKRALGPLREFVDAAQAFLQVETATWDTLVAQDFCSKTRVSTAVGLCESNTLKALSDARDQAGRYLSNPQTRGVLFNAIEANVFKAVNAASNLARDLFKDDEALNNRLRELLRSVGALRHQPPSLVGVASPLAQAAEGAARS
jgi:hypothetical protein